MKINVKMKPKEELILKVDDNGWTWSISTSGITQPIYITSDGTVYGQTSINVQTVMPAFAPMHTIDDMSNPKNYATTNRFPYSI